MIKPMLAKSYEEYKNRIIFPVWSQPKLDGLRAIATKDGLFSRLGNRFAAVPHIEAALRFLFAQEPNLVLDGELYSHTHRDNFPQLCSIIKRTVITSEVLERSKQIEYWVFDIVSGGSFLDRYSRVQHIVAAVGHGCIKLVPTQGCPTVEILDNEHDSLIRLGYEGQMVRTRDNAYVQKRTASLLKRKELDSEVCVIHDVIEGEGKWLGMAGAFWCRHPNGQYFSAALADNDDLRRKYWLERDTIRYKHAEVLYQKLLPSGTPRHPRVKGIITTD